MALAPGTHFGHYDVTALIGESSMEIGLAREWDAAHPRGP